MEKTIEEIRESVQSEIVRLCKNGEQPKFYWGGVWMRDGLPMFRLHIARMLSMGGYIQDLPESTLRILYSLMGLEARDAVDAERAKSAKLVEALERIQELANASPAGWRQKEINQIALKGIVDHGKLEQ